MSTAPSGAGDRRRALAELAAEVAACRACPRLVAWRESASDLPAARAEPYWARPLPGFGDPAATLLLVGLAPAAHGGNRTGRMFTGDRSGDFLFAALWRAGFASQPTSTARDDGLELRGAYVTAAVRCAPPANKPSPSERDKCRHFFATELALLPQVRVVLTLGAFGYEAAYRLSEREGTGPRPPFAHGLEVPLRAGRTLVCSYHPSQRNVFTGLLTAEMFDNVLRRAQQLGAVPGPGRAVDDL